MDDFERLLEQDLALMLDPIVNAPAPRRRGRGQRVLKMATIELATIPAGLPVLATESVAIGVPVGSAS